MRIESDIEDSGILAMEVIRKNPKLFTQCIGYLLGLPIDSTESITIENRLRHERWRQDGYYKALFDIVEYWEKHHEAIKGLRLNNYEGVKFLFERFVKYRRDFFIYGCDIDIPITHKEIEELKKPTRKRGSK